MNTKKILILGHMKEEVEVFRSKIDFWRDLGKEVIVEYSSIGKTLAAAITQKLIYDLKPDLIISVGLVGSLSKDVSIGDIGIIEAAIDGEIDIRPLCSKRGEFYTGERVFKGNKKLIDKILKDCDVFSAYAVTVSSFMTKEKKDQFIKNILPELLLKIEGKEIFPNVIEMECSAIFHIASLNKVPCLGLCAVSDSLDGDAVKEFDVFLTESVGKYLPIMDKIILGA